MSNCFLHKFLKILKVTPTGQKRRLGYKRRKTKKVATQVQNGLAGPQVVVIDPPATIKDSSESSESESDLDNDSDNEQCFSQNEELLKTYSADIISLPL